MGSDTYSVAHGSAILARGMSLEDALLFAQALFNKYWRESNLSYTIAREPKGDPYDVAESL